MAYFAFQSGDTHFVQKQNYSILKYTYFNLKVSRMWVEKEIELFPRKNEWEDSILNFKILWGLTFDWRHVCCSCCAKAESSYQKICINLLTTTCLNSGGWVWIEHTRQCREKFWDNINSWKLQKNERENFGRFCDDINVNAFKLKASKYHFRSKSFSYSDLSFLTKSHWLIGWLYLATEW